MPTIKIGRHCIELSHLEKQLFPRSKIKKDDIISYYNTISTSMVPLVKNHLLTMVRYPNGIKQEGFYQKDIPDYFPSWFKRFPVKTAEGKTVHYGVFNQAADLVYMANQGCLTPHAWLSAAPKINYPDRLIIDLDPSGKKIDMKAVRETALSLHKLFHNLDLTAFIMTTGSRGLHVVVPLAQRDTFDVVRDFAYAVCCHIAQQSPQTRTVEIRKSARRGRIFLDYLRNSFSATSVAPYAVRAREQAPVATPLDWDEIEDPALVSTRYTIKTVHKRLEKKGNPWHNFKKSKKSLKKAQKLLQKIIEQEK